MLAGTGDVGAVQRLTHAAVMHMLHGGQVAGGVQGQAAAFDTGSLGGLTRGSQGVSRQAGQLRCGHVERERVGGVQHML